VGKGLSLEDLQRGLETLRSASTNEAYLKSILEKQITYKDILEMEAEEAKKEEDVPMTPGENTPPSEQDGFQF
jgi:hypothetical protein